MGFAEEDKTAEQEPLVAKEGPSLPMHPVPVKLDEGEWSTGLCDCCAHPGGGALGCVSLFMPFVQFGVLAEQLPTDSIGRLGLTGSFCKSACAFAFFDIVAGIAHCNIWPGVHLIPTSALLHMKMRTYLRTKYGIKGSWFGDLCTSWWCGPCALAQETREMVIRARQEQQKYGAASGGPAGADAPQQQVRMLGHMIMAPAASTSVAVTAVPNAPGTAVYGPGAVVVAEPVPANGVPVSYNTLPPIHVATVSSAAPSKDPTATALLIAE